MGHPVYSAASVTIKGIDEYAQLFVQSINESVMKKTLVNAGVKHGGYNGTFRNM